MLRPARTLRFYETLLQTYNEYKTRVTIRNKRKGQEYSIEAENREAENKGKPNNNWKYRNHEKRNVRIQKRTKL